MPTFLVDTKTSGHKLIIRRLKRLVSTLDITDNGQYVHCSECSMLTVDTSLTETQLEHWLWKNNLEYLGVSNDN
jgi:hypothetical protein